MFNIFHNALDFTLLSKRQKICRKDGVRRSAECVSVQIVVMNLCPTSEVCLDANHYLQHSIAKSFCLFLLLAPAAWWHMDPNLICLLENVLDSLSHVSAEFSSPLFPLNHISCLLTYCVNSSTSSWLTYRDIYFSVFMSAERITLNGAVQRAFC